MIGCPECGSSQYPGTIFCSDCGKLLLGVARNRHTAVLPFSHQHSQPLLIYPDVANLSPAEDTKQILLLIPSSRRRHQLQIKTQARIGRADREANIIPEIDFTSDQGIENGISRLHAVIELTSQGILLTDLNSTNGTTLNKVRLPAEKAVLLKSGDEIRFGDLLVHIFFD